MEHWKQIPQGYVGVLEVDWSHWACHWQMWHVVPGSTLLSLLVIHEGTVPSGPIVSCTSQQIRHLGALQGHWLCLALCCVLLPSPKSQVTGWRARPSPRWAVPLMQLGHLCSPQPLSLLSVQEHTFSNVPCLLRVTDHRLALWTVHEPRNSSLATVNQLGVGGVSGTKIPVTYFLLPLAVVHIPVSLRGRKGLK